VDYLSGTVYTLVSRLKTVPFRVTPRDMSVSAHQRLASEYERILLDQSEFMLGWDAFISKFVEDLLCYTRVIHMSQMPSPAVEMRGVGFCAVSRCINIAQSMLDVLVYKQEKLGSRPLRALLLTGGGLDPDDVTAAMQLSEQAMDNKMLRRYSNVVVIGGKRLPNATLDMIELSSLPDGFDEQTSTILGMSAIALAFGMDPRELFPALTSGATKAEALISHIKQRGKGPGEILQAIERQLNAKFLPASLQMSFDFQDDEQDRQQAEIKGKRAERYVAMFGAGLVDARTMREQMLGDGDLTEAQFERLELEDGRLPDGSEGLRRQ